MPTYTIDDQPLHVVEAGQPNRQVAVLIHGWSSSWYACSPLLPALCERFHCLAVDLPGYGESPRLPERTTISDYVDLLARFIETVSPSGPVVLVGHSMGGMISATLALRYPVLVERMVLICPTLSGKLSNFINIFISPITLMERFGMGSLLVSAGERLFVGFTDRLMRPASFAERTGITLADYKRLRADARRPGQGLVRAECYFAMRDNNLSGKLGAIQAPALVLWGAEDNTVPLRDAGMVADEWPSADLRIIPKAGHWPHFEAPETTLRHIAAFLGLPLISTDTPRPMGDDELAAVQEIANFLAHSDIGNNLSLAQRTRLAAQFNRRVYPAGATLAKMGDPGTEMFVVQVGTVEVWNDPDNTTGIDLDHPPSHLEKVTDLKPGQLTGELAMLDMGRRSAELIAGPEGAKVLCLNRARLLALCEDDAALGTRLLFNIATAMALRVRFILWQLQRATTRLRPSG